MNDPWASSLPPQPRHAEVVRENPHTRQLFHAIKSTLLQRVFAKDAIVKNVLIITPLQQKNIDTGYAQHSDPVSNVMYNNNFPHYAFEVELIESLFLTTCYVHAYGTNILGEIEIPTHNGLVQKLTFNAETMIPWVFAKRNLLQQQQQIKSNTLPVTPIDIYRQVFVGNTYFFVYHDAGQYDLIVVYRGLDGNMKLLSKNTIQSLGTMQEARFFPTPDLKQVMLQLTGTPTLQSGGIYPISIENNNSSSFEPFYAVQKHVLEKVNESICESSNNIVVTEQLQQQKYSSDERNHRNQKNNQSDGFINVNDNNNVNINITNITSTSNNTSQNKQQTCGGGGGGGGNDDDSILPLQYTNNNNYAKKAYKIILIGAAKQIVKDVIVYHFIGILDTKVIVRFAVLEDNNNTQQNNNNNDQPVLKLNEDQHNASDSVTTTETSHISKSTTTTPNEIELQHDKICQIDAICCKCNQSTNTNESSQHQYQPALPIIKASTPYATPRYSLLNDNVEIIHISQHATPPPPPPPLPPTTQQPYYQQHRMQQNYHHHQYPQQHYHHQYHHPQHYHHPQPHHNTTTTTNNHFAPHATSTKMTTVSSQQSQHITIPAMPYFPNHKDSTTIFNVIFNDLCTLLNINTEEGRQHVTIQHAFVQHMNGLFYTFYITTNNNIQLNNNNNNTFNTTTTVNPNHHESEQYIVTAHRGLCPVKDIPRNTRLCGITDFSTGQRIF